MRRGVGSLSLRDLLAVLMVIAWALPASIGIVDAGCWFFTAAQCTRMDWVNEDHARIGIAVTWTIGSPLVFGFFIALFD